MPKAKTHSGASKRFRRTGTGKIVRQQANRRTCWSTSRPSAPPPGGPHHGVGERRQRVNEVAERLTQPF